MHQGITPGSIYLKPANSYTTAAQSEPANLPFQSHPLFSPPFPVAVRSILPNITDLDVNALVTEKFNIM